MDPDLKNEKTVEYTGTVDHQLSSKMAVSLSYIYRQYSDFRFSQRVGIDAPATGRR